jgi:beta-mannosidase
MVWQDLMFANMDYPDGDAAFVATVTTELTQQLERLDPHPCVVVICGNSEVEQQAAMWGATRDAWQPRLFHEIVPALLAD